MGIAGDIIIIIIAGWIAGFVAYRLKLPLLLGYIVVGIIIGPHTGGFGVSDAHRIELLAEIGVALLLFSIGLDLSLKELQEVRSIALIGAPFQIALTLAYGTVIGRFFLLPWPSALLLGAVLSLSSTMIVLKTLMNRGLTGTLSGRVMVGILIVQDLAAVPMMILIPQLKDPLNNLPLLGFTALKAVAFLAFIIFAGVRLIPYVLGIIARLNSRELFLLSITAISLGVGYLTHLAGLSFAFGAFVAGMVISESDYSHQALNDIIPLRDVFGLIFFTSIGMLFDPAFFVSHFKMIAILVTLTIVGKFVIFVPLCRAFGYFNIVPLAVGLGLAQIGEFSFVLARMGLQEKIIDQELFSVMLATAVLTMLVSPFLSMAAAPLYSLTKRWSAKERVMRTNFPKKGLADHVLIAGGGRVGQSIASILYKLGYSFVLIEQDFRRFETAKKLGHPVIYGDAAQDSVLQAAAIRRSRLLLITIPSLLSAREIVKHAMRHNAKLKIIARAESTEQIKELHKLNVYQVVQPEFEAALEIIRRSLMHFDMPVAAIQKYIDEVRRKKYSPLYSKSANYRLLSKLANAFYLLDLTWVNISPNISAVDKSIQDLEIRSRTGVSVVGALRGNEFMPNPGPDFVFKSGDMVAVIGNSENVQSFEKLINGD